MMNDSQLDQLLHTWTIDVPVSGEFHGEVWQHIGREAVHSNIVQFNTKSLMTLAAAVTLLGVVLGLATRTDTSGSERDAYLSGINPITMSHER